MTRDPGAGPDVGEARGPRARRPGLDRSNVNRADPMRLPPSGIDAQRTNRDGGFALVVVLLSLGLLAMIAATFMLAVRAHVRSVAATSAAARAEAMADSGVSLAVLDTLNVRDDRTRGRRFPVDGTAIVCRLEEGRLQISVQDEAGRVDLNSAGEALLMALMRGSGFGETDAERLAQRILDYRDRDNDRRANGAERSDYEAAGLPKPKNAPFDAVDELAQVLGADAALLDRLRGAVTVHSGLAGVDPKVMSPNSVALIAAGAAAGGAAFTGAARATEQGTLPQRFVEISPQQVFRIRSVAETADGARFVREAVVDLGPRRARSHTYRRWTRGSSQPADLVPFQDRPVSSLPPC